MMQKIMDVTLDARQVQQACEKFVESKMRNSEQDYNATVPAELVVTVAVIKKRKPRAMKMPNKEPDRGLSESQDQKA